MQTDYFDSMRKKRPIICQLRGCNWERVAIRTDRISYLIRNLQNFGCLSFLYKDPVLITDEDFVAGGSDYFNYAVTDT